MSIDFFLLNRKCSQKLLTKFSHAEVCFFTEIPGKRLLYHQVSPVSRRGWGWWIQCFDSTGVRVGNSEKSLQYSWLLANRLLQSIVHVIAIYWHLMHHFNKKNTNIEKKTNTCFCWCFLCLKKKKTVHLHSTFPRFLSIKIWCLAQLASLCCCWPGIPWLERAAASQLHWRCSVPTEWKMGPPWIWWEKSMRTKIYVRNIYTKGIYIYIW